MKRQARLSHLKEITIHHSASARGVTLEEIRDWHTDPDRKPEPFNDIGYHFVIEPVGRARIGRKIPLMGAHAPPNDGKIGICVTGNNMVSGSEWTTAQTIELVELCKSTIILMPWLYINGHHESEGFTGRTACPGIDLGFLRDIVEPLRGGRL